MRVVSLTCSNTEIVCALGQGATLVGVDDHSDYPTDVLEGLPRVGKDLSIDIDKVMALNPDLILASLTVPGHERVVADVEKTGVPYIAPRPQSLADVGDDIRTIAALLGVPHTGEHLCRQLVDQTPQIRLSKTPSVLVEWWPKPVIVPAQQSWVTDLIRQAGGHNPFGDLSAESTPITAQQATDIAPDLIVVSWCGVPEHKLNTHQVLRRKGWEHVPAVQHQRVVIIPESLLGRPGPRLIEGYQVLKRVIRETAEAMDETARETATPHGGTGQ